MVGGRKPLPVCAPHLGETWGWGWGVTLLSPSPISTGASPRFLLLGLDAAKALGAGGVLCSQEKVCDWLGGLRPADRRQLGIRAQAVPEAPPRGSPGGPPAAAGAWQAGTLFLAAEFLFVS